MWIVALALELLGSPWDVSWHFKWLRDDFAPPHLMNTAVVVVGVIRNFLRTYPRDGAYAR